MSGQEDVHAELRARATEAMRPCPSCEEGQEDACCSCLDLRPLVLDLLAALDTETAAHAETHERYMRFCKTVLEMTGWNPS